MPRYVVDPADNIDPAELEGLDRAQRIERYKARLELFKSIIAGYSADHGDKITLLEGTWTNTSVLIETDPGTAAALAADLGVRVSESRKLNPELSEPADGEKPGGPAGPSP